MQMISKIILLTLAMIVTNLILPWWGFIIWGLSTAWYYNDLNDSIFISANASILSWLPLLIYSYLNGGNILFSRVSQMMGLPYPFLLILSSGILVALLGALAGLSGYYLKVLFNDD